MANINSDQMAIIAARPSQGVDVRLGGGRRRTKVAIVEHDGTQSNADVARYFRVKSGDLIHSLLLSCDAISGMTDVNIGLYTTDDGAAVDDNLFDDAQTLATKLTRQEKRVHDASSAHSALGPETLNKKVWELLGLTADPFLEYDVCGHIVAAGSASGTVVLEMEYTAGD